MSFNRRSRLVTAAGLVLAGLMIAACGSSGGGSSSSTTATTASGSGGSTSVTTSGGTASSTNTDSSATVDIGFTSAPTSLDPADGNSGEDYPYLYLLYDRLIDFNAKTGVLEPGLATKWAFSANKLEFDMTIRTGVKFQDGTPLDATAVMESLQHFQTVGLVTDLAPVTSITAPTATTVVMKLKSPYSPLPAILADRAGMIVSPTAVAKYGTNFGIHPVGAGPYEFVSEVTNASVNLARFSGYWGGSPPLAAIDWKVFQSDTALVSAVKSGVVQVALGVAASDVSSLKSDSQLVVSVGPSLGVESAYFNSTIAPANSALFRQAFNYALNRSDIAEVGTNGLGSVAWQVLPAGAPGYAASESPTWPQNVAKAKSLLTQAGDNHVTLNCVTFNGLGYENTGPVIQSQMAAVGIKVNIKFETVAEAIDDFFAKKDVPCFLAPWTGRPDPAMTYSSVFTSTGGFNPGATNYGVDALNTQLNAATAPAARDAIIAQMVKVMIQTAPFAPLYSTPEIVVLSTKVGNYVPNFLGKEDFSSLTLSK
jgi:peptide/nickel transport system substrate-binding protein